jgi:DNA-binding GntR family transcriptional regulator
MRDLVTQHQQAYQTLRQELITGGFSPGTGVTLRGVSATFKLGMMPTREAINRLAGEGALEIRSNGRVYVPELTRHRFEELMQARLLLEPHCAQRAAANVTAEIRARMIEHDENMNVSYSAGRPDLYMLENYRFHFALYRAAQFDVLLPLLESVWMQFGPFMRRIYDQVAETPIVDKHKMALQAIERGDEQGVRVAIEADILDAIHLMRTSLDKS